MSAHMLSRLTDAAMRVPLPPYPGKLPRTPQQGGAGQKALRAAMHLGLGMRRAAGFAAGCAAGCMVRLRARRGPIPVPIPVPLPAAPVSVPATLVRGAARLPETEASMIYVVSACLAGVACRFDGKANPREGVIELVRQGLALPVCPEQLGGLATPRPPCELREGQVLCREADGTVSDATEAFAKGAEEGVRLALLAGCTEAILKARSPSCGCGRIYDGTFSRTLVDGDGLFAAALRKAGITVRCDE